MHLFSACLSMLLALSASRHDATDDNHRLAPEFPKVDAARWLNSPPLKMADLRGKVILLEVWTFM